MQVPVSRVRLEDVRRSIDRTVIRSDDEVDAEIQMVPNLGVDDVRLIADDERLDEFQTYRLDIPMV